MAQRPHPWRLARREQDRRRTFSRRVAQRPCVVPEDVKVPQKRVGVAVRGCRSWWRWHGMCCRHTCISLRGSKRRFNRCGRPCSTFDTAGCQLALQGIDSIGLSIASILGNSTLRAEIARKDADGGTAHIGTGESRPWWTCPRNQAFCQAANGTTNEAIDFFAMGAMGLHARGSENIIPTIEIRTGTATRHTTGACKRLASNSNFVYVAAGGITTGCLPVSDMGAPVPGACRPERAAFDIEGNSVAPIGATQKGVTVSTRGAIDPSMVGLGRYTSNTMVGVQAPPRVIQGAAKNLT